MKPACHISTMHSAMTNQVSTHLTGREEEASGVKARFALEERLAEGDETPDEHDTWDPAVWADSLGHHVAWEFQEDDTEGEERLTGVDVGRSDTEVLEDGVRLRIADIGAVLRISTLAALGPK